MSKQRQMTKQKPELKIIGMFLAADGLAETTPEKAVYYIETEYLGDKRIRETYAKVVQK